MTDRTYAISGAGFTLQGTIDAERIDLLMRLLDKVARELALAPAEIGAQKHEKRPKMNLELEIFGALCACSTFRINGVDADTSDFGEQYDADPSSAEDYSCGDMTFFPKDATAAVLGKYSITEEEYTEVARQLAEKLSFGSCGWCA